MEQLEQRESNLQKKNDEVEARKVEIENLIAKQTDELQRISRLSVEEAKQYLLTEVEKSIVTEKADLIRRLDEEAKEKAQKNAQEVIGYAIQKCAADHTSETTVSIVSLPNDDMKGRIIGREGRNIKTLETLTGIDLIIDDKT